MDVRGTVKALAGILVENGWSEKRISKAALDHLLAHVEGVGRMDKLKIPGLRSDRVPVFAGGLSILLALFEVFELNEMSVSKVALREGVLYTMVMEDSFLGI